MLVRMRTNYATGLGTCAAGKTIVLPTDEASMLVATGYAVEIKAETPVETPVPATPAEVPDESVAENGSGDGIVGKRGKRKPR